ncbi:MAG: hypothetical protein D6718_04955 [Acidobacteria bacterium]|nr:MAG: hypothetical protein D6718_04955 [Acidobacteriota bacterium]
MRIGRAAAAAALAAAGWLGAGHGMADVLPWGLKIERVLDNAAELGDIVQAPTGELWLLERGGTVRVFDAGRPAATLSIPVSTACESGLLDVAFDPAFAVNGRAFVYYVDGSGHARVDELFHRAGRLELGATILDLGSTPGGCRPGGGLAVGPDGKLYVGVGDLEMPSAAQDDASLAGKVLRVNLDGSVPADNPTAGSLVFAKGFRDVKDLAINPDTARPNGTVYGNDLGANGSADDEINAVRAGGEYGWNITSGNSGGAHDDPLVSYQPTIAPEGVEVLSGDTLGSGAAGSLVYACVDGDDIRQAFVTGPEGDLLDHERIFYDPNGDRDGTPDAGCPHAFRAVAEGADGALYAGNDGSNPGIWRIWSDRPGPREVSSPGSPFPLTVERSGPDLLLGWENLGTLDAGRAKRHGGQRPETYQIWEGTLPIAGGAYDHTGILATDGTPDGPARLTATVTPGAGNRYYLVSAQGDNMEGSLGAGASGERPGRTDYCDALGYGKNVGQCAKDFVNPADGSTLKLVDYNPYSPTYMQRLSLADFRGLVFKLALTAENCFWCTVEADQEAQNDQKYRGRDFIFISVYTLTYSYWDVVPPSQCAAKIQAWAEAHNSTTPILCDEDHDGDGRGDATVQWDTCGGAPQNYYVDQGFVVYNYVCGAQFAGDVEQNIINEVNPETCE